MAQLFHSRKPKFRLFSLTLLGLMLAVMSSIPFAFASTPNLEVEVSNDVDTVAPGQLFTYRITIRNTSTTDPMFPIVVSNVLPPQVTYVKASDGGSYDNAEHRVTWGQGLRLEPDTADYRYVTVRVISPLAVGTTLTNNASAWIVNVVNGETSSPSTAQDTDTVRNVAPIARDESYTTNEGTPLPINLVALASDRNADPLTFAIITEPTKGTLTPNGNGSFTYTPTEPEIVAAESDSFTYQVQDPQGALSNIATISITIQPVNDAPVAVNDTAESVYEDNTAAIAASTLLANDTDVDSATLTITAVNPGANGGTVALSADKATITYQPAANFNGADSFTYVVSDGTSEATATVSISVLAVNDAPSFTYAGNQSVAEDAGPQTVTSWATAISAGPVDEQGQTLTFQVSTNNNTLFSAQPTINANGTLTYTPAANTSGVATVTVTLVDNGGTDNGGVNSTTQTFTITVAPANDAPVANDDAATTQINTAINIDVLFNDTDADLDPLSIVTQPMPTVDIGTVEVVDNVVRYTPPTNYQGTLPFDATIQYTVTDGTATDTATVFVTVTAINNAPTAIDHAYSTNEDVELNVSAPGVITGATDDGGVNNLRAFLDPDLTTRPKNGRVELYWTGGLRYVPNADFQGTDTFRYYVSDSVNKSEMRTVTITVNAVNDAPSIMHNGNISVLEDSAAYNAQWITSSIPGPADESAQTVSWTVTNDNAQLFSAQPAIDADGTLTFTPAPNAFGTSSVTVNVSDSGGATSPNIFTISLTPVNDAPSMTAGANVTIAEDSGAFSAVWASGLSVGPSNESAQSLTFALTNSNTTLFSTQPAISANGTLTFTPAANAFGVATVTVVLQDNGGTTDGGVNSTTATFTITITGAADAPVANDDTANTTRGQALTIAATTLLLNDSDVDGDPLTISSVSTTSTGRGTVARSGNDIVYTPAAGFVGVDTFTYTISDGQGGTATATVSITVRSQHMLYLPQVMSEVSTVVTPPATPDLVGSFSISPAKTTFSTTEQVVVTAQVTNQGNAPAGPFWVDLYINPTTEPSTTNIAWNTTCSLQPCQGIAWYVKDGLAPGQSITLTSTSDSYMSGYTIWSGQFNAGTSDLYLYVDSWNPGVATGGVAENNETNNRSEQRGIVVSGTSAQAVGQTVETLPERPAHPSN